MNARHTAAAVLLLVSTLAFGATPARSAPAQAAAATTPGTWSIAPSGEAGRAHFALNVDDPAAGRHSNTSSDVDAASLGISSAQLASPGNHVAFTLARDAGSFACEGWIARGAGGGTFVFTPSAAYVAKMRALGYADLSAGNVMTAAMVDLSTAYVASIAAAGYPHLPFDKLIAFRALKIDDAFVRSMHASFGNDAIDADDMIAMRALRVTGAYLAQMRAAGFAVPTPRTAIQLQALQVDLTYVRELAAAGYPHLTPEELIQLRALHIDAAYVKRVEAHGYVNPTVEQLVRLKALNVI